MWADRRNRATLVALLTVNGRLARWQDKDISILLLEQDKDIFNLTNVMMEIVKHQRF